MRRALIGALGDAFSSVRWVRPRSARPTTDSILSDLGFLSISNVISNVVLFARQLLDASLLGPVAFGFWVLLKLIRDYSTNLTLGITDGLHREIPILRGQGLDHLIPRAKGTVSRYILCVGILSGVSLLIMALLPVLPQRWRLGCLYLSVQTFLQLWLTYYQAVFRAEARFREVSTLQIISASGALLTVPFVLRWRLEGVLLGQIVISLMTLTYCVRREWPYINAPHDWEVLLHLGRVGIPIMLVSFAALFLLSADRIVIAKVGSMEKLGLYGFAQTVTLVPFALGGIVNAVMFPRFCEEYGRRSNSRAMRRHVLQPLQGEAIVFPLIVGALDVLLEPLLTRFAGDYLDAIPLCRILLYGMLFYVFAGMCANLLVAINKTWIYVWSLAVAGALNVGLAVLVIKLGYGITGVAGVAAASLTLFGLWLLGITIVNYLSLPPGVFAKTLLLAVQIIVYVIGAARVTEWLAWKALADEPTPMQLGFRILLFFTLATPLVRRAWRLWTGLDRLVADKNSAHKTPGLVPVNSTLQGNHGD